MNIKKRLEKLEATVKGQTIKVDFIRIIVEADGTISGAIRRGANGEFFSVSDKELTELRAKDQLPETELN